MFKIEFKTDNAAFEDDDISAIRGVLEEIIERVTVGDIGGILRDENGNRIGAWSYVKD